MAAVMMPTISMANDRKRVKFAALTTNCLPNLSDISCIITPPFSCISISYGNQQEVSIHLLEKDVAINTIAIKIAVTNNSKSASDNAESKFRNSDYVSEGNERV